MNDINWWDHLCFGCLFFFLRFSPLTILFEWKVPPFTSKFKCIFANADLVESKERFFSLSTFFHVGIFDNLLTSSVMDNDRMVCPCLELPSFNRKLSSSYTSFYGSNSSLSIAFYFELDRKHKLFIIFDMAE